MAGDSLGEYEKQQLTNTERNSAQLKALGLISGVEELRSRSNCARSTRPSKVIRRSAQADYSDVGEEDGEDEEGQGGADSPTKKRKRRSEVRACAIETCPTRPTPHRPARSPAREGVAPAARAGAATPKQTPIRWVWILGALAIHARL